MNLTPTSLRLLVVGHHATLRHLVRRWVEGLDFAICECSSDTEAARVSGNLSPDWVLVDAQLRPGPALAVLRQLKSQTPSARFVLVSDFDDATLREAARRAGANHYLLKEDLCDLPALLSAIPPNPTCLQIHPEDSRP
jgi:two-component system, NarL family, invasion response regulator UvrY